MLRFTHGVAGIVLLLAGTPAHAANAQLTRLFEESFHTSLYQEGRCGSNIMAFVSLAARRKIPLGAATIVSITDTGYDNFGMVRGWKARQAQRPPSGSNWYSHVFLVASGQVYDFDFTNEPRVLPLRQYVAEMFGRPTDPKVLASMLGPGPELETYQVELIDVRDYLERRESNEGRKLRLVEFLAEE